MFKIVESVFPKTDGDILYASEVNATRKCGAITYLEGINQNTILSEDASITDKTYTLADSDTMSDTTGYNDTIDTGNTTAVFSVDRYWSMTDSDNESNATETSGYGVYATKKTITLASPKKVTTTTNETRATHNNTSYALCRMKFNYSDSTSEYSNVATASGASAATYAAKTYTNPSQEKLVTSINVQVQGGSSSQICYERNDVVIAFAATDGLVVQTEGKTFSENVNSILVSAHNVLNGSSTMTVDVSTDGGSTWDITDEALDTLLTLDGDDTDVVIKFNLNVVSGDGAELLGYSYQVWT